MSEGALRMMARWNLDDLDLTQLSVPVTLIVGDKDGMVPPADSVRVAARLPQGSDRHAARPWPSRP